MALMSSGVFSLGTTYIAIFTTLTAGLDELMTRQIARQRTAAAKTFGVFFTLRLVLSGLEYAIFYWIISSGMNYQASTAGPVLILGICMLADSLGAVGQTLMIANETFAAPLIAASLGAAVKLGAGYAALQSGLGMIAWAWVAGSLVSMVAMVGFAARLAGKFHLRDLADQQTWRSTLRACLPFLALGILIGLEYQADMIILSKVGGEIEVSWYGMATTIVLSILVLAQSYRAALYPIMLRAQRDATGNLNSIYNRSFFYLGAMAFPLTVGVCLVGPALIQAFFGPEFYGAILPLQIVSWLILLNILTIPNSRLLLTHDRQDVLVKALLASVMINLGLNLFLDARLGATGAAIARIASGLLIFTSGYIVVVRRYNRHNLAAALSKPALASLVMAAGVWAALKFHWLAAILIGVLLYAGVLLAFDALWGEKMIWPGLRSAFKRRPPG